MVLRTRWVAIAAGFLSVVAWFAPLAGVSAMSESPFPQRRQVPPLPRDLEWVNTATPLEWEDLRGKFVLLDFWTYCCINCMHILPELEKLEEAYPRNLVVIGVHSAKFQQEQKTKNIVEAILRYKIAHPVINDSKHVLWDSFGVQAWPTLILIDPEGYAVWGNSGESTFEKMDPLIKDSLPYYRKKGLLDETPLRFQLEAYQRKPTALRFPGKVLADEPEQRLFIADSGHNRIVIARLDGTLMDVVGSGLRGKADGEYSAAQFDDPQGMALAGSALYVADTKNHAVRKVDLDARRVSTVTGTGQQRRDRPFIRRYQPKNTALYSPWDLWTDQRDLYIAMAGSHQIWKMDLGGAALAPYAGNAREDIVDGKLLPEFPYQLGSASFAQPSGLASDGTWLFVADSEGSSIRAVPLDPRGEVKTVVGTAHLSGARLFTFGDVDGPRQQVRLQHPLGVAYANGQLFVADTYNNKIKVIDPKSGQTSTLSGASQSGLSDDPPRFYEPAGISAAGGRLYVADTNNHQIRIIDLQKQNTVSTLELPGLKPPSPPVRAYSIAESFAGAQRERLRAVSVRADQAVIRLAIELQLPRGYKINEAAPMAYLVESGTTTSKEPILAEGSAKELIRIDKPAPQVEVALPVRGASGEQTILLGLQFYYCRSGAEGICKAGSVVWTIPIRVSAEAGQASIPLRHRVPSSLSRGD